MNWLGDDPLPVNATILVGHEAHKMVPYVVSSFRHQNGRTFLTLAGIADRTAAERLSGQQIFIPREALPPPGAGEAYLQDLLGAEVFLENGDFIGVVDHFEATPAQDVWVIRQAGKPDVLFPAREEFIASIDAANRKIIIAPPPGLLEIYRA